MVYSPVLCGRVSSGASSLRLKTEWKSSPPSWLAGENPDWPGNYKVRYWNTDWQKIIFGEGDSYLGLILDAGFDGVYLDIIDAFEYFENLSK